VITVVRGNVRLVGAAEAGRLHLGFAPGGPQDRFSCAVANLLVGNARETHALEATLGDAEWRAESGCFIAVTGAPATLTVDDQRQPRASIVSVTAGARVLLRPGWLGCRCYVAVAGGLEPDADEAGRYRMLERVRKRPVRRVSLERIQRWAPRPGLLRILPGPEASADALDALTAHPWTVDADSSGAGVRLRGAALPLKRFDITSSPVQDGTLQATREGPIALLRGRGTLGGYPRLAQLVDCDVDRLAQLRPGHRVRFEATSLTRARALLERQEECLRQIENDVR
jgi:allophanate hydrolase subunit 2